MRKKAMIFMLIGLVLIGGCITTYFYLGLGSRMSYKNGIFVDGGMRNEHAEMYHLYQSL